MYPVLPLHGELEEASSGYIVERGFWNNYWIVDDWTGRKIDDEL